MSLMINTPTRRMTLRLCIIQVVIGIALIFSPSVALADCSSTAWQSAVPAGSAFVAGTCGFPVTDGSQCTLDCPSPAVLSGSVQLQCTGTVMHEPAGTPLGTCTSASNLPKQYVAGVYFENAGCTGTQYKAWTHEVGLCVYQADSGKYDKYALPGNGTCYGGVQVLRRNAIPDLSTCQATTVTSPYFRIGDCHTGPTGIPNTQSFMLQCAQSTSAATPAAATSAAIGLVSMLVISMLTYHGAMGWF
jgi:hypothetical protein